MAVVSVKINREPALSFNDITLVPGFSTIASRKTGVSIDAVLKGLDVSLGTPVVVAPMSAITSAEVGIHIHRHMQSLTILHRYNSVEEQVAMVNAMRAEGVAAIGAAIGTKVEDLDRARALLEAGANVICVDVAHGDHSAVVKMITSLREIPFYTFHIMAGNVATYAAYRRLCDAGADSVRVSVASGSCCETYVNTAHGLPTAQALLDVSKGIYEAHSEPQRGWAQVVADGGIKNTGDIVKALACGADLVMTGSMWAACPESPESVVWQQGEPFKRYYGQASKLAQMEWKGEISSNEGVDTLIPLKPPIEEIAKNLIHQIKTGLSYSGAATIEEFQYKAQLRVLTPQSHIEGTPHILRDP